MLEPQQRLRRYRCGLVPSIVDLDTPGYERCGAEHSVPPSTGVRHRADVLELKAYANNPPNSQQSIIILRSRSLEVNMVRVSGKELCHPKRGVKPNLDPGQWVIDNDPGSSRCDMAQIL